VTRILITLAISDYDHVADLTNGRVPIEGIEPTCLNLPLEEIFFRSLIYREFDVFEISFAKYASLISRGDKSLIAIPVFPSRVPRHSAIYIRRDGPIQKPGDLSGCRIGIPEWAQTAGVYARGFLVHQYDLDLASVDWVQAGVNQAGRIEKAKLQLPRGVKLTGVADKTLSGMLVSGEIDAAITAVPPDCFEQNHAQVGRMFEDFLDVELRYVQETGIFPIMHTIAIRRDLVDKHPWLSTNLFTAFQEAKRRSLARALYIGATRYPIPWCYEHARRAQKMFGDDFWPYGIETNRKTLTAFLQYAHEQGICHCRLAPEELFSGNVQKQFRV
jgi:4,5-dihydroxyphthalate decarboxylase